jgi:hypothetical protein
MNRTLDQWAKCDPKLMATAQSPAAVQYALADAKADIATLARERDALAADNLRLDGQVAAMKSALLAAEKAILRLQAEVPMSNRISAQATKARCAAKKAALSSGKEVGV